MKHALTILVSVIFLGCASTRPNPAKDAKKHIAAGQFRLYQVGGFVISTPGVSRDDHTLDGIPRSQLSSGCTDPSVASSSEYARTYNAEMVKYLAEHPEAIEAASAKP